MKVELNRRGWIRAMAMATNTYHATHPIHGDVRNGAMSATRARARKASINDSLRAAIGGRSIVSRRPIDQDCRAILSGTLRRDRISQEKRDVFCLWSEPDDDGLLSGSTREADAVPDVLFRPEAQSDHPGYVGAFAFGPSGRHH